MTKPTIKKTKVKLSEMSDADQVRALSALLKVQPDILQREPKLIELLEFGDQQIGNVTSLANRQTQRLKEELSTNKRRTQELLENARHYDELTNKIYALTFDILSFTKNEDLFHTITLKSPNLFEIDYVELRGTLKLADTSSLNNYFHEDLINQYDYRHVMARLAQGKCLCSDRFPESVLEFFFSDQHTSVKSAAFIPLIGQANDPKKAFGILAYGSTDKDKFSSGLRGTVHLERIGKIVALSLERINKQTN